MNQIVLRIYVRPLDNRKNKVFISEILSPPRISINVQSFPFICVGLLDLYRAIKKLCIKSGKIAISTHCEVFFQRRNFQVFVM